MERRPNIVFIISDDQGYWSLGCSGNREILTPNIDRLAACGMRFENFFCASPVCSPARASLLTGTIPSRHGVHDWLKDDDERQASLEYLAGQYSYTRALVENGYCCALSKMAYGCIKERCSRDLHTGSVINREEVLTMERLCTGMENCTGKNAM